MNETKVTKRDEKLESIVILDEGLTVSNEIESEGWRCCYYSIFPIYPW
jgi:hypothetical protein